MLVDLLVALLRLDAVLGGRADQQPLQADRLATVVTPAEAVVIDAAQGHFQLRQQALVALDDIDQPVTLLFHRGSVGRIGGRVQGFNGYTALLDALLGLDLHGLQQLGEVGQLLSVHVVISRHGQQLFLCH